MNMTFQLNGKMNGSFERVADTKEWTYNYTVYSITGLENKEHTFAIQPRGDVNTSYLVFDYFTYEYVSVILVRKHAAEHSPLLQL